MKNIRRSNWFAVLAAIVALATWLPAGVAHAAEAAPHGRKYVVAFAQDTLANDWRVAQVRDARDALAKHADIEFAFSDAKGDTARQIKDIDAFAARGVDVLITSPRDAEAMREPIARAYRQGIPVILLSRRVSGDEFTQVISADNRAIARQAAQHLARLLNGKGRILVLSGVSTASAAIERNAGFEEALKAYPGLRIVANRPANYLRAEAIRQVEAALSEKLAFDAIYSHSDGMALGAIVALKKAGRDPRKTIITGIDYIGEAREAIRAGELAATFTYPTAGQEGAALAVQLIRNSGSNAKAVAKEATITSIAITRDNVDQVAPIF